MEIFLIGLVAFVLCAWLWGRRSHFASRKELGYDSEPQELEPIFKAREKDLTRVKRELNTNLDKLGVALSVLEKHRVIEHFEALLTPINWHSIMPSLTGFDPDPFPSSRIQVLETLDREDSHREKYPDSFIRDSGCFRLDGEDYDFFAIEFREEGEESHYRFHFCFKGELAADIGLHHFFNREKEDFEYSFRTGDIQTLILGPWVEKLPELLELLGERRRWIDHNVSSKRAAQRERDLEGRIDLGDYEP